MVGNVWEWAADWYSETFYQNSPLENPLGPETGTTRVLRGGSWQYADFSIRSADRNWNFPEHSGGSIGFRCARPAQ